MRWSRLKKHWPLLLAFVIAWIVFPTGTPEDAVTTLLFIKLFGVKAYFALCGLTLLFLGWMLGKYRSRR